MPTSNSAEKDWSHPVHRKRGLSVFGAPNSVPKSPSFFNTSGIAAQKTSFFNTSGITAQKTSYSLMPALLVPLMFTPIDPENQQTENKGHETEGFGRANTEGLSAKHQVSSSFLTRVESFLILGRPNARKFV